MIRPLLNVTDLGTVPTGLDISCRESFTRSGDILVGCIASSWHGDFVEFGGCWSRDLGRWDGAAPFRVVPSDLRIDGATNDESGTYPVAPVDADTGFMVLCGLQEFNREPRPRYPILVRFRLWDAATGDIVQTVDVNFSPSSGDLNGSTQPLLSAAFDGVPSGSYQLGAHITAAYFVPITVDFYKAITGLTTVQDYEYSEVVDGVPTTFFWDWRRNLGRKPSDTAHAFYALRSALLDDNAQLDRPEWAGYITSGSTDEGEWSFLRVQSGAGTWAAGDVFPNPGPALRLRVDNEGDISFDGIAFDTMARCISSSKILRVGNGYDTDAGDMLIGGTLATDSGPVAALWRLEADNTSTLLGWNRDPSDGLCQCFKRNHGPNGIVELRDGTILVLSECSLLRYDPYAATLGEKLPRYPFDDGDDSIPLLTGDAAVQARLNSPETPGGYSLRLTNNQPTFFTENFAASPPGEINFYNRIQEFAGNRRALGPGTPWHGRECSASQWGMLWAWSQDRPFSDPAAQNYLSYFANGHWQRGSYRSYPVSQYRWKQIAACSGKLLNAGILPNDDAVLPVWGVDNGRMFQEYACPYIPLYLTTVVEAGRESLLGIAYKVTDGVIEDGEHLIRIEMGGDGSGGDTGGGAGGSGAGPGVRLCALWNDSEHQFSWLLSVLTDAGADVTKWPPFLWWHADASLPAGGVWLQKSTAPLDSTVYLEKIVDATYVHYHLPDSFTYPDDFPYDFTVWERICFPVYEDGGTGGIDTDGDGIPDTWPDGVSIDPEPSATNAGDALGTMPPGSHYAIVQANLGGDEWQALQVGDVGDLDVDRERPLAKESRLYPNLWARVNSSAAQDDLTTYTQRIRWGIWQSLSSAAVDALEICVLMSPAVVPNVRLPDIDKRG